MRRGLAGLILGLSLVVASVSWAGFIMSRTVLDPGRSERLADQLFENEDLRAALVDRLAAGIDGALPTRIPVPRQVLQEAADQALDDPSVQAAVRDGIVTTHRNALEGSVEPVTIDATALGAATRASLVEARPELDNQLPPVPPVQFTLPTAGLGWLGALKSFVERFTLLTFAAAVVGGVTALVVTSDRPAVLRRVSFWVGGACLFWLVIGYGAPLAAGILAPTSAAIVAALIDVFFGAMIGPALTLGAIGVALLVGSFGWNLMAARRPAAILQPARPASPARPPGGVVAPQPPPVRHAGARPRTSERAGRSVDSSTPPPIADATVMQAHPGPLLEESVSLAAAAPEGERSISPWVEGVGYVEDDADSS